MPKCFYAHTSAGSSNFESSETGANKNVPGTCSGQLWHSRILETCKHRAQVPQVGKIRGHGRQDSNCFIPCIGCEHDFFMRPFRYTKQSFNTREMVRYNLDGIAFLGWHVHLHTTRSNFTAVNTWMCLTQIHSHVEPHYGRLHIKKKKKNVQNFLNVMYPSHFRLIRKCYNKGP